MSRTWKDTKTARERLGTTINSSVWGWPQKNPGKGRWVKRRLSKVRRHVSKFGERHSSLWHWEREANWKGW